MERVHQESKKIYGAPKMTRLLNSEGIDIAERTVSKYMNQLGLKAHYIQLYIMTTKNSDFSAKFENILARNFNPDKPNAAWCTDITYV